MSGDLYLVGATADQPVCFRAAEIGSVVTVGDVTRVHGAPEAVLGLFAVRSLVLTLIDVAALATGTGGAVRPGGRAVAVEVGGHHYGLVLDRIDDVSMIASAEQPAIWSRASGWSAITVALIDHDGTTRLVLDPAAIVTRVGMAAVD